MSKYQTFPFAVAILLGCGPRLNFPVGADAGGADVVDGASADRLSVVDLGSSLAETGVDASAPLDAASAFDIPDVTDVATVDIPQLRDVPEVDTSAAGDVVAVDAVEFIDVPVVADVVAIEDAADALDVRPDGGSCPTGMALVPAGTFVMGDADTASYGAQPPHQVILSAFCMDISEVTVAAYRACRECTVPDTSTRCNWNVSGRDSHPINCVDWNQARAFCQSLGRDLPTEAQWEYAARGTDNRVYPWGSTTPASQLCWNRFPNPGSTCPVRSYPSGNSPYGLFDMAGNVREWTLDWYAVYSSSIASNPTGPTSGSGRVYRGGSWDLTSAVFLRAAYRRSDGPSYHNSDVGFRCSRAPQ
jgi:formylglycine-generating enzyme required for sulfatase activity